MRTEKPWLVSAGRFSVCLDDGPCVKKPLMLANLLPSVCIKVLGSGSSDHVQLFAQVRFMQVPGVVFLIATPTLWHELPKETALCFSHLLQECASIPEGVGLLVPGQAVCLQFTSLAHSVCLCKYRNLQKALQGHFICQVSNGV